MVRGRPIKQQSLRELQTDLENAQIRIGRIRKQDQGKGQFGQCPEQLVVDVGRKDSQPERPADEAKAHGNDRPADGRFLQAPGDGAVDKDKRRQDRQILVHELLLTIS